VLRYVCRVTPNPSDDFFSILSDRATLILHTTPTNFEHHHTQHTQTVRGMTTKVLLAALIQGLEDGRRGVFAGGDLASLSSPEGGMKKSNLAGAATAGGGASSPSSFASNGGGGGPARPFDLGATLPGSESVVMGTRLDNKQQHA
jgi:hypothetical protein